MFINIISLFVKDKHSILQIISNLLHLHFMLWHADQRVDLLLVQILAHQIFERLLIGRESLSPHQQLHVVHVHRSSLSQTAIIHQSIRNGLRFAPTPNTNIEKLARDMIDFFEDFLPHSPIAVRHYEFLYQRQRHFSASTNIKRKQEKKTRRIFGACGFWFGWGFEDETTAKTRAVA